MILTLTMTLPGTCASRGSRLAPGWMAMNVKPSPFSSFASCIVTADMTNTPVGGPENELSDAEFQ